MQGHQKVHACSMLICVFDMSSQVVGGRECNRRSRHTLACFMSILYCWNEKQSYLILSMVYVKVQKGFMVEVLLFFAGSYSKTSFEPTLMWFSIAMS